MCQITRILTKHWMITAGVAFTLLLSNCKGKEKPQVDAGQPKPNVEAGQEDSSYWAKPFDIKNAKEMGEKVIKVTDMNGLLANLGSNRTLEIESKGEWVLPTKWPEAITNTAARIQDGTRGRGLELMGIENLHIKGMNKVRLVQKERNQPILVLSQCKGIVLENLEMDHGPKFGCGATVLELVKSDDVTIKKCNLQGSGTEAIFANECKRVSVQECELTDCSLHVINGGYLTGFQMLNTNITKNKTASSLFFIANSEHFVMSGGSIVDNTFDMQTMIEETQNKDLRMIGVKVENNKGKGFIEDASHVSVAMPEMMKGNSWQKGQSM